MKARIYDFDPNWDYPDGSDIYGEYVLRDVDYELDDNTIMLKNGLQSKSFFIESINKRR